jgi:hypothetical protein
MPRIAETAMYCCVRLECSVPGGTSVGSGFYFGFTPGENPNEINIAIVTNRHVVAGATELRIRVTLATQNGEPDHTQFHNIVFEDFGPGSYTSHPNPEVDLVCIPVGGLLTELERKGLRPYLKMLRPEDIISGARRRELSAMESITMIGYPNGLFDTAHNLPLFRRGVTASPPWLGWSGGDHFLTDIASFSGSSGSPVFVLEEGSYLDGRGNTVMGAGRVGLLGVHYAGMLYTASGEMRVVAAPTSLTQLPVTQIPMNIGLAINAERVLDFIPLVGAGE